MPSPSKSHENRPRAGRSGPTTATSSLVSTPAKVRILVPAPTIERLVDTGGSLAPAMSEEVAVSVAACASVAPGASVAAGASVGAGVSAAAGGPPLAGPSGPSAG